MQPVGWCWGLGLSWRDFSCIVRDYRITPALHGPCHHRDLEGGGGGGGGETLVTQTNVGWEVCGCTTGGMSAV